MNIEYRICFDCSSIGVNHDGTTLDITGVNLGGEDTMPVEDFLQVAKETEALVEFARRRRSVQKRRKK